MSGEPRPKQGPKQKRKSKTEFTEAVKARVIRRSLGHCEAQLPGCWGKAVLFHHILRRSHGGEGTEENCLHLCTPCHTWIHDHPAESEARGMLTRSSNAG